MRGSAIAAAISLLLVACATQESAESPEVAGTSPTLGPTSASRSASPEATAEPTTQPTPRATPTPTPAPTATPFGAAVFDDPDDCEHSSGAYRVAFPDAWWYNLEYEHDELGHIAECRFFAPDAFDIDTADRRQPVPDGVAITIDYVEGGCVGHFSAVLEEREVSVDGHQARVQELAEGPNESGQAHTYQYVIDLRPDVPCESSESAFIVARTSRDLAADYEDNKALLDRMIQTMEIREP